MRISSNIMHCMRILHVWTFGVYDYFCHQDDHWRMEVVAFLCPRCVDMHNFNRQVRAAPSKPAVYPRVTVAIQGQHGVFDRGVMQVCDFIDEDCFRLLEVRQSCSPSVISCIVWGLTLWLCGDFCHQGKLGPLFYFTPTNPTGHYKINLHQPAQHEVLTKLVAISIEERIER